MFGNENFIDKVMFAIDEKIINQSHVTHDVDRTSFFGSGSQNSERIYSFKAKFSCEKTFWTVVTAGFHPVFSRH
jgi:hypothetical protein